MEDEVGKYKKKTKSDVSKANKKSKHKHIYEDCMFHYFIKTIKTLEIYSLGSCCKICGKIGGTKLSQSVKLENGYWRSLTNDELLDAYKDLEIVNIPDMFAEYITREGEKDEEIT